MSTDYHFELKFSGNYSDSKVVTAIGDLNYLPGGYTLALILLHLTLSAVGMYITYRIGFRSGIQAGIRTLAGVLNASLTLRDNNTDTSSRGKENHTRPTDSGEG